jgi:hypothetical protein
LKDYPDFSTLTYYFFVLYRRQSDRCIGKYPTAGRKEPKARENHPAFLSAKQESLAKKFTAAPSFSVEPAIFYFPR